jgi:membrane protease subunit HflK
MRHVWIVLLVLLAGYTLTGVVQVRRGERAVVRRFGRVLPHQPEPGLWVGLPWGMDRVDRVVVDRVQSVTVGFREEEGATEPAGQLLTGDHNLVNVQAVLFYKVRPDEVVAYVEQADRVNDLLTRGAEAGMAEWVAGRTVDDVLLHGKNALRSELLQETRRRIGPYQLGVDLLDVRVALITPPEEVKDAFDSVARAQTQIATQRYKAEEGAASRLRMARAERYRTEQATAAYVHSRKLLARREAERFEARLRQYRVGRQSNPHYLRQIWEEERGRLFARLKEGGQLDVLDHRLAGGGLDLFTAPVAPAEK